MVKKYIKKPVTVEAIQWDGKNYDEVKAFVKSDLLSQSSKNLKIKTLEGDMTAIPTDFIVKGVDGEFYPCKEGIFHKTYSEASNTKKLLEKNTKLVLKK